MTIETVEAEILDVQEKLKMLHELRNDLRNQALDQKCITRINDGFVKLVELKSKSIEENAEAFDAYWLIEPTYHSTGFLTGKMCIKVNHYFNDHPEFNSYEIGAMELYDQKTFNVHEYEFRDLLDETYSEYFIQQTVRRLTYLKNRYNHAANKLSEVFNLP